MSENMKKGLLNGVVTLAIVVAGMAIYDKVVAPRLAPKKTT